MTDTEKTNTDIAVTQKDFEEPSEDVSGSPLWNKDLAPTSICFWAESFCSFGRATRRAGLEVLCRIRPFCRNSRRISGRTEFVAPVSNYYKEYEIRSG